MLGMCNRIAVDTIESASSPPCSISLSPYVPKGASSWVSHEGDVRVKACRFVVVASFRVSRAVAVQQILDSAIVMLPAGIAVYGE